MLHCLIISTFRLQSPCAGFPGESTHHFHIWANFSTRIQSMLDDTIAAIATPLGEGGLAVIRISGPEALAVADRCFVPLGKSALKPSAAPTHTIHYGRIMRHGRGVDEVMVAVLRAPRTLTREDVVEI